MELKGVRKKYGQVIGIDGVDLKIPGGEIFAVIGPDGAGKTTLLRIIAGILSPDEGEFSLFGDTARTITREMKGRIGYLAQGFALYRDLTVEENLEFFGTLYSAHRASGNHRPLHSRKEYRRQLLQFTRLEPFRKRLSGKLSGGMQKKLALACALIHRPELIVLDEPTTGVDPVSRREFWTILKELQRDGLTIAVSTPYLDEADRCDRVGLLKEGRFLAQGTPAEITAGLDRPITEVVTSSARAVRKELQDRGFTVQIQGNRVHVYDASSPEEISSLFEDLGVVIDSIAVIPPTMEDAYIALQEKS
ncbi:MAG: ABC transporter ATP-binding protein [Alkalispirochaeta sp.]